VTDRMLSLGFQQGCCVLPRGRRFITCSWVIMSHHSIMYKVSVCGLLLTLGFTVSWSFFALFSSRQRIVDEHCLSIEKGRVLSCFNGIASWIKKDLSYSKKFMARRRLVCGHWTIGVGIPVFFFHLPRHKGYRGRWGSAARMFTTDENDFSPTRFLCWS